MAVTEYYVDPAINADSGTGTIGDPFGDLQYALNTVTRDSTNGDQFNIKAGTSEVLTGTLSLATYGTPTITAPLIIRGYTSTSGDGGRGTIDGAGAYTIGSSSGITWIDLRLTNSGANTIVTNVSTIIRCEVDTTAGDGISCALGALVLNCYVRDYASTGTNNRRGIVTTDRAHISGCYIKTTYGGQNATNAGILINGAICLVDNCVVSVASSHGIHLTGTGDGTLIKNNTIYGGGSSQVGIQVDSGGDSVSIINNIITGFSGAGGDGIVAGATLRVSTGNAFYNNTTHESYGLVYANLGNNDALGSDPFVDGANGDFDINGTVTGVTEDGWPQTWPGLTTGTAPKPDKGAIQAGAGAGGGGGMGGIFGSIVR